MGNLDPKPAPPAPSDNFWRFTYKQGPAPMTAYVKGKDEDEGYRVAVKWCELQGFRPPAKVFAFISAGPEILTQPVLNPPVAQTVIRGPVPEPMVR